MINSELISTGSELLSGRTLNSHAQTLGGRLAEIGIRLVRDTSIPDEPDLIVEATRDALERNKLVFISGGLGPTQDDTTCQAVARLLKRRIVRDTSALERIKQFCQERNRKFNEHRARQADVIDGATVLPNPVGAAPGQRIDLEEGRTLFVLPGPPAEFRAILDNEIVPWLQEALPERSPYIEKVYMLCGLGEGDTLDLMDKHEFPPPVVDVAFCAAPGRLEVRLSCNPQNSQTLEDSARRFENIVGPYIFADHRITLEEVVGNLLGMKQKTIAIAESCTGGLLGGRLTSIPGSSSYFKGGIISYSNETKVELLDVSPYSLAADGAVSASVAEQMAKGVRKRMEADYGLGITGIAGPAGGTEEKPVGLVYISLADDSEVQTSRYLFGRGRNRVRRSATQMALDMLRREIQTIQTR